MIKRLFEISVCCCIWVTILACSGDEKKINRITYTSFPKHIKLQATTHKFDKNIELRYPFRIEQRDSVLIVFDLHNADNYFHAFNYPSCKYTGSFGYRGEASSEIEMAISFHYCSNDSVWTLDSGKSNLVRWGLSPQTGLFTEKEVIKLNEPLIGKSLDFVVFNDSIFIIPDYSGEDRLVWINKSGEIVNRTGRVPAEKKYSRAQRPALGQAWRSFISYNYNNHILVSATQLGEVIEIYNLNDNSYKVLVGEHGEPKFDVQNGNAIPNGIMGFVDVKVTNNFIYAVFIGRTFDEIKENIDAGIKLNGGNYIYVFTIDGEPVCKYELDKFINTIQVNEGEKTIIAIEANKDMHILEFGI